MRITAQRGAIGAIGLLPVGMITAIAFMLTAAPASAVGLAVVNASFETLAPGGLPNCNSSGTGCYSIDHIPGWLNFGNSGQFQPLPPQLNSIPAGATIAYTNGGTIEQVIAATAVAGRVYTLKAEIGFRKDVPDPGTISLVVGSTTILGLGTPPAQFSGDYGTFTAVYTALASDAGAAIRIVLGSPGVQGDFDNVRLSFTDAVPEPTAWMMLTAGFGLVGAALRRRSHLANAI